jgi:hypothetical protein
MAVVLFTWNPSFFHVSDRQWNREIKQIQDCGFLYSQWSCGRSKFIKPGDDAFLLRQGTDRRGIVAHGTVTSEYFEAPTWDDEKEEDTVVNYVDITWTTQLQIDQRLPIETLQLQIPEVYWSPQGSGTQVAEQATEKLFQLWNTTVLNAGFTTTTLDSNNKVIPASTATIATTNGCCQNCHFDSQSVYGTNPQAILVNYKGPTDTANVALCRNCHTIAASFNPQLNIADLEKLTTILF